MAASRPSGGLGGGLVLIGIGLIFLGINFGWWSPAIWEAVFRLWPLILILVGMKLLLPRQAYVGPVLFLVFVAAVIALASMPPERRWFMRYDTNQQSSTQLRRDDAQEVKVAAVTVASGAGEVKVRALDEADNQSFLYKADMQGGQVRVDKTQVNDRITLRLSADSQPMMWSGGVRRFDLRLSREPDYELVFKVGAADTKLELQDLRTKLVELDGGASAVTLRLGDKVDQQRVVIKTGASSVDIYVPSGAALRIQADSGLSGNNFDTLGLEKRDDIWQNQDYDTAAKKINLEIKTGASSVNIRRY